jgi:hypothetical protein
VATRAPYRFGKRLNDGLVGLTHPTYGEQLWVAGAVRKRGKECQDCKKMIPAGAMAYRPLTNGYNRMERLCVECVDAKERAVCGGQARPATSKAEAAELPTEGPCFHCEEPCTSDNYCFGCKSFICEECDREQQMGFGHDPSDHLLEEERDVFA